MKQLLVALSFVLLAGCSTFMPQRYNISADNHASLVSLDVRGIDVGGFSGPEKIDASCRPFRTVAAPDGMTFVGYIRKAFEDELKSSGAYESATPSVTLSGQVEVLGLSDGVWNIRLRVTSTNGRSITVSERYDIGTSMFSSDDSACRRTADGFLAAVQNLLGRLFSSPEFKALATPA